MYYSNLNLPGLTKTWPNVNPRFGPKPVPTDFEAHAVAATAFVVMTYTLKARAREAEQLGKSFSLSEMMVVPFSSSSLAAVHA